MVLTKGIAIKLHRKMWNWIADKTREEGRCVLKEEYPLFVVFERNNKQIANDCWCCEYANKNCNRCPIDWGNTVCDQSFALYNQWFLATALGNWKEATKIAKKIADLPEKY